MSTQATKPCAHPSNRIFAWFANGVLCAGCCECGEILAGAAEPWRQVTEDDDGGEGVSEIHANDAVFEARFVDGHALGSSYWNGFGPYACATDDEGRGFDTICVRGADIDEEIANGKARAVEMLRDLITYEQRGSEHE